MPYPKNFLRLLRVGGKAKRKDYGGKHERDNHWLTFASFHLITRSARASTFGGMGRPSCLAVFRLITNSNFVGVSMGSSVGLVPLRILSTSMAARRKNSL